jgi:hypothetical protein
VSNQYCILTDKKREDAALIGVVVDMVAALWAQVLEPSEGVSDEEAFREWFGDVCMARTRVRNTDVRYREKAEQRRLAKHAALGEQEKKKAVEKPKK